MYVKYVLFGLSDPVVPSYSTFMKVIQLNAPRESREGLGLAKIIICVIKVYLSTKYFLCLKNFCFLAKGGRSLQTTKARCIARPPSSVAI